MQQLRNMTETETQAIQTSVPTHGNWAEERGFGQQISVSSDPKQYDLNLLDRNRPADAPPSKP
jgi:hypothetical protein